MPLCTCPRCGHAWNYRGAVSQPDEYVCCPKCSRKFPLRDVRQYKHPADEIEAGVRDLIEATRHRATVSRRRVGDREEICVEVPDGDPV